jgi:hypothetical protein
MIDLSCAICTGKADTGVRRDEHHFGVDFEPSMVGQVMVTLDGRDITGDTFEAWAGLPLGWVAVFSRDAKGHRYRCRGTGGRKPHAHAVVIRGEVQVKMKGR